MANGKIKGKQIEDTTISLDKLSGAGTVIFASGSQLQITGTASGPNDVVTKKELSTSGTNLQVTDYLTGATFGNVENLIFRGQTVTVPAGTATGVLAVNGGANAVVVWIPAPSYVDYFNTAGNAMSAESTTSRFVADPTTEGTPYYIGNWTTNESTSRDVLTENSGGNVSYVCTDFAVFDTSTTLDFTFTDGSGATTSISLLVATGSTSANGLTINVSAMSVDQDRYKASATFTADLTNGSLIPNGGRFSIELVHNNSGDGTYTFTQNDIFYDSDGSTSNASIDLAGGGTVSIEEETASVKWLSGIGYYDSGSTFTFSVTEIDNLNDRSYPRGTANSTNNSSGQQLRLTPSNFAISTTFWGHSTDFIGWTNSYNAAGFDYITLGTINSSNQYEPGFGTDNVVNSSSNSSITANLYDWNLADSVDSPDFPALIDTYNDTTTYNNNPIVDEDDRLDMGSLGTASTWDNTASLPADELQMIFGRVIYPQDDFSGYYPQINITNARDYSSSATASKTFDIYTDTSTGAGTVASTSINGYRWFATTYGKSADYTTDFSNGIFEFGANWVETDLHHDQTSAQNEDLVILVGVDSSGANTTADRFFWVSNDATAYPGRSNAVTYNLTGGTKQIQFTKGSLSFSVRRCWLLIGYSDSANGIDLYLNDIAFS